MEGHVRRTCLSLGVGEDEGTDRIPGSSKRKSGWYCSVLAWMQMAHHAHLGQWNDLKSTVRPTDA